MQGYLAGDAKTAIRVNNLRPERDHGLQVMATIFEIRYRRERSIADASAGAKLEPF